MGRITRSLAIAATSLLVDSCATTQSRYVMLGQAYPGRAEDCQIDVFRTGGPARDFVKISRVDVHLEKTHFITSGFEDALPEIQRQACLSGADAIIEVQERSSSVLETRVYHVTATGIKYRP